MPVNTWMTTMNRDTELTNPELESPLMSGPELWRKLGYRSANAFAQAARRGTTPVPVFPIAGRKGQHALRADVSAWLSKLPELARRAELARPGQEGRTN